MFGFDVADSDTLRERARFNIEAYYVEELGHRLPIAPHQDQSTARTALCRASRRGPEDRKAKQHFMNPLATFLAAATA